MDNPGLKPWHRFHIRLTLLYGLLVLVVLVVMSVMFYRYAVDAQVSGLKSRLRDTATALATGVTAEQIAALHDPSAQGSPAHTALVGRLAQVAAADPELSDVYVMRPSPDPKKLIIVADHVVRGNAEAGKVGDEYVPAAGIKMLQGLERPTVEDKPYTDAWGTLLSGYAPIRDAAGTVVGLAGIDVQFASVEEMKARVRRLALILFASAALALIVLARIVGVSVREPLYRIIEASSAIAAGKPRVRTELERKDEFGVVGRHFDVMASGLEERDFIKTTFGTYVSPQVVRRVLEERREVVAGEQRDVVVLFSDLRSFTTISEKLTPQQVVSMLNDYLERMSQAVINAGGRIDKFIGDALMADWGALETVERGPDDALRAALDMWRALGALNRERQERGESKLHMGIGVHAGPVIAGSIGSRQKLEFTVIGDAVNVASRLEGLCKLYGAVIVASRSLIDAAANPPKFRRLDRAVVAGKTEALDLVEVLDDEDPRVARIETYERGMDALYAKNWDAAIAAFEEAGADLEDGAIKFQLDRARSLRADPARASAWDGIERRRK